MTRLSRVSTTLWCLLCFCTVTRLPVVHSFLTTTSSSKTVLLKEIRFRDSSASTFLAAEQAGISSADVVAADSSKDLRGKVNEIDFCIAPADASLSRASATLGTAFSVPKEDKENDSTTSEEVLPQPQLSLTRYLNNASNRAVRRILLAKSWPSAEALNLSLAQVTAQLKEKAQQSILAKQEASPPDTKAKCPVPRPILNVLTRKRKQTKTPFKSRTDQEYIQDQLQTFRKQYGTLPNFDAAEAYLECILLLATSGEESPKVKDVMQQKIYDEAYRRVLAVLRSVGAVVEQVDGGQRTRIAKKLLDRDICLSTLDKFQIKTKQNNPSSIKSDQKTMESSQQDSTIAQDDLGGVLLSAQEPTVTRQLNVLSNIVQRALLFGGDEELLVLAETLDADRPAFVQRWYPDTGSVHDDLSIEETDRSGLQYLNCLVQLLRNCYDRGIIETLEPPLPLPQSYAYAYERLVATAVELGSGYIKPTMTNVLSLMKPRTATEELGRFAVWESNFRSAQPDVSAYPEDLVGTWEVRDLIAGQTIGTSTVSFLRDGELSVEKPLEGLRWRLDAGPAHLDTCSFQVLSSDGTVLQYRGFIDRGARLESRFSKRALQIRGDVQFQMRDGSPSYFKDMLPINYRQGTTKFAMTKVVGEP